MSLVKSPGGDYHFVCGKMRARRQLMVNSRFCSRKLIPLERSLPPREGYETTANGGFVDRCLLLSSDREAAGYVGAGE
jgi:hypothetical protein